MRACLSLTDSSLSTLLPTDQAFLARQKAKADAEFYSAQRTAEANKVRTPTTFSLTGFCMLEIMKVADLFISLLAHSLTLLPTLHR